MIEKNSTNLETTLESNTVFNTIGLARKWFYTGPVNSKELRIFAPRRSGHHAIINWIMVQKKGQHYLLNNCKRGNPYYTCIKQDSLIPFRTALSRKLFWVTERRGIHAKKDMLIYNFENADPEKIINSNTPEQWRHYVGPSKEKYNVLILRDPFNLFASKLRWARGKKFTPKLDDAQQWVDLWIKYAREFVNESDLVPQKVCISYNKWFSDKAYRRELASKLKLPFTDDGRESVAKWGPTTWGDSFDGLRFEGHATKMKVTERWKKYKDDPFYVNLFRDSELISLSEVIFGKLPGTEKFIPV